MEELARLRAEVEQLTLERDRWREQARGWRAETRRLFEESESRPSRRLARFAFRVAWKVWRALPMRLRDGLRPLLFPAPEIAAPTGLSSPVLSSGDRSASATVPFAGHVSVVIPTRDAGSDFERVLDAINAQEGVEVELIVVDSGSTDGTRERALAAGARVEAIAPDEFGHGRTRDLGASLSTGDPVVMMVQDAVLLGSTALRDLVVELESDPNLAAVSAREIPRSDADLYGAFVVWAHYRAIWPDDGKYLRDEHRVRSSVALGNVCAAIRRAAWEELRFSDVDFAEDLDFGIRACRAGWSVALSSTAAVAHSHTRDVVYHLRRSAADRLFGAPLLSDQRLSRAAGHSVEHVYSAGHALLPAVEGAVALTASEEAKPLSEHLQEIATALTSGAPKIAPSGELARLNDFLAEHNGHDDDGLAEVMKRELLSYLRWEPLAEFAQTNSAVGSEEVSVFMAKTTAAAIGRTLGDSFRYAGAADEAEYLVTGV